MHIKCILYIYNNVILSTSWHLATQNVGRLKFCRVSMMLAEPAERDSCDVTAVQVPAK